MSERVKALFRLISENLNVMSEGERKEFFDNIIMVVVKTLVKTRQVNKRT